MQSVEESKNDAARRQSLQSLPKGVTGADEEVLLQRAQSTSLLDNGAIF